MHQHGNPRVFAKKAHEVDGKTLVWEKNEKKNRPVKKKKRGCPSGHPLKLKQNKNWYLPPHTSPSVAGEAKTAVGAGMATSSAG